MQCPHCQEEITKEPKKIDLGSDVDGEWRMQRSNCANCGRYTFELENKRLTRTNRAHIAPQGLIKVYPRSVRRLPVAEEVPGEYAVDFREACLILEHSPKASAALTRRCLQHVIRHTLGIERQDLFQEIQDVIESDLLPSDICESLGLLRRVANFSAFPIKSLSTGEIVAVEPQEAEWNLDVLEMIFDYLFIRPAAIQKKKSALHLKLREVGRMSVK